MGAKHKLKVALRELYARGLFHSGLHGIVNRLMPPRLTILAGHCVKPASGPWPAQEHLPPDMWIEEPKLERILRWFQRHYELVSVGDGATRLERGLAGRSLLALSLDDGYRDNARVLGPLLARVGAPATVFLESRPLEERRLNWSHKYFWILARRGPAEFVERYGVHTRQSRTFHALNQVVAEGHGNERYHLKRILKYECDPAERDAAIDALFAESGGDERALCDELYMDWDEARTLARGGVELGGHTVTHAILSKLPPAEQAREVSGGALALAQRLGRAPRTFAYPWGRRWDFDAASEAAARDAGFSCAVTMHAGVNRPATPRFALKRLAIDGDAQLHLLATEACGGFELLRRFGLDLSE